MWPRFRSFLQTLLGSDSAAEDLDDEFRFHLEARVDDLERRGVSRTDAMRQARREFGGAALYREAARESRGVRLADELRQDVRQALRLPRRSPAFAMAVVAILTLGIGASTAVFSVVDAVLLRPPAFASPDQLLQIKSAGSRRGWFYLSEYRLMEGRDDLFKGTAAYRRVLVTLTGGGEPDQLFAVRGSSELFRVLGVQPRLGRTMESADNVGGTPVAAISHRLWHRRFHASADVLERSITVFGKELRIVGVMPPEFEFPVSNVDLWVPLAEEAESRDGLHIVARKRDGVSLEQIRGAMQVVQSQIRETDPGRNGEVEVTASPWRQEIEPQYELSMILVLTGVGCVLLIACANVAGLLLGRAAQRQREIAIRSSLGADRWRVARGLLAESLLLSVAGGVAGVALSHYLLGWAAHQLAGLPIVLPHLQHVALNERALSATILICLAVAVLCSLAPILFAGRTRARAALSSGERGGRHGSGPLFSFLVGSQAAFAFLLLVGSGLMITSMVRLEGADKGFATDNILTMRVPSSSMSGPRSAWTKSQEQLANQYQQLIERIERIPEVEAAAYVSNLPLSGFSMTLTFAGDDGQKLGFFARSVSPDYLHVMRIPLLSGRHFGEDDGEGAPRVAIINEFLARQLFADRDPIGRLLPSQDPEKGIQVVGVAKNSWQSHFDRPIRAEIYLPYKQLIRWPISSAVVLRTSREPSAMAEQLRAEVWTVDPDQPVLKVETMEQVFLSAIWRPRFSAWILSTLGALALLLSAVGVYAVVAYTSSLRLREVGIRMAVGATPRDVVGLILKDSLTPLAIGLATGGVMALLLSGVMAGVLYETQGTEPEAYLGAAALMLAVGAAAGLRPALRAAGSEPLSVLRAE